MLQSHRFRLIAAVFGVLAAHTLQVWIFAGAFYLMHHAEGWESHGRCSACGEQEALQRDAPAAVDEAYPAEIGEEERGRYSWQVEGEDRGSGGLPEAIP